MYSPTFKRALIDAATADAVRSARYAHHQRDWDHQRDNPILRRLRRVFRARGWRWSAIRRGQEVAADVDGLRS
jgi:hypothetical protein